MKNTITEACVKFAGPYLSWWATTWSRTGAIQKLGELQFCYRLSLQSSSGNSKPIRSDLYLFLIFTYTVLTELIIKVIHTTEPKLVPQFQA